jgi:hypothetical protein
MGALTTQKQVADAAGNVDSMRVRRIVPLRNLADVLPI